MVLTHAEEQFVTMQLWLTFNTETTFNTGGVFLQLSLAKKLNSEPSFNHVTKSTLRDNTVTNH